jgi:membrane protease subunit (stomatin/prohibitin family)
MLKTELLTALQPAFAKISEMGIRYSAIPGHTMELSQALNDVLSARWRQARGLAVASFGVNSITASKEDEDMIKSLQKSAVMRDPSMAAANLAGAQADAMRTAASNTAGAMTGFLGLNLAQQSGGLNAQSLYEMGSRNASKPQPQAPAESPAPSAGWTCSCGQKGNTGKFCAECGKPKPALNGWTCSCGAVNKSKFCVECGKPKPAGAPIYRCDKCGWEPKDPHNAPKFCPECGDPFDAADIVG